MRQHIFDEIDAEREYQDQRWGGAAYDDSHNSHDWIAYITRYLGNAVICDNWTFSQTLYRTAMIKVAALAVAAVEWVDRNNPRAHD